MHWIPKKAKTPQKMKKTTVGKILLTHPVLMAGAWGLPFGRHSNMKNEDSFLGFMHDDKNRWYFMNCIVQRCGDLFGFFCNGGLMKFERNKLVRNPNPNTTQIQSCLRQGKNARESMKNSWEMNPVFFWTLSEYVSLTHGMVTNAPQVEAH